jgi:hypothetical protein
MFGGNNVGTISFTIHTDPTAAETYLLWRAPSAITIKRATMQTNTTQGSGTATPLAVHNYGTAGTAIKSTGGTAVTALGGTAVASILTADVPVTKTTILNAYVAEGEYLVLAYGEEGSGWQSGEQLRYQLDYVVGKSADNA